MSAQVIRTIVIPAGGIAIETLGAKIFKVVSSTAPFTVKVDNGDPLDMSTGRGHGSENSPPFSRLVFTDTSGSANTVRFYVGDVPYIIPEPTTIAIDPASATAITPAQQTLTPDTVEVNNAVTAFADCKAIVITNTGGTNITYNTGAGARTLLPNGQKSFSVFRHQDKLATVTVDTTGGGLAEVDTIV